MRHGSGGETRPARRKGRRRGPQKPAWLLALIVVVGNLDKIGPFVKQLAEVLKSLGGA